jgi:hypothetical protein
MRRILGIGCALAIAGVLAGCGDEDPTEVGSDLLGEGLRTVEVVLEHSAFLQGDTTYDRIGTLNQAAYGIVADSFAGELEARVLFRVDRPYRVTYEDTAGSTRTDSLEAIRGGTLTVVVDTLFQPAGAVELELVELLEDWHPGTVSWANRADTADVAEPWAVEGGSLGAVLATGTWETGDTLQITVDSAAAAVWHDTLAAFRGGALQVATPGARMRIQSVDFAFDVVPVDSDTLLTAGRASDQRTIASPDTTDPGLALRVGGLPVWRSMLHFLPLAEVRVPCESGPTTCTIALSEVAVNTANLIVRTAPVGGRRIERPMRMEARAALEGPGIPLTRLPLSQAFGRMEDSLDVSAFADTATAVSARIPVTNYVRRNVAPPEGESPLLWLALTAESERTTFGYGQFHGIESAMPPQLQLVVTIPVRKVTP